MIQGNGNQTGTINQTTANMGHNQNQNHSQSPPNPYQVTQINNNEGNFKKNSTGTQVTPVTSTNSINSTTQIPQQVINVVTGNNYGTTTNQTVQNQQNQNNIIQTMTTTQSSKISEEHKSILEGVKLAMEIIDSRIPNYSGYAHLILTKNVANLENLLQRPFRKEII